MSPPWLMGSDSNMMGFRCQGEHQSPPSTLCNRQLWGDTGCVLSCLVSQSLAIRQCTRGVSSVSHSKMDVYSVFDGDESHCLAFWSPGCYSAGIALHLQMGNGHTYIHMDSVVKLKSLPFDATQLDIILFFEGYKLRANGVQLVVRSDNKATGEVSSAVQHAGPCAARVRAHGWRLGLHVHHSCV